MIYKLKGEILEKDTNYVVIDTGGVAYEVSISLATYAYLGNIGEICEVYTYMAVREDGVYLYGFATKEEKRLFLHLITVSSIGPKMAVKILGGIGVESLISAISSKDYQMLAAIPGIGKKTAERIVVELKDKFDSESTTFQANFQANDIREEVVSALVNLGYKTQDARKAVEKANPADGFEVILKNALQLLSGKK